MNECPSVRPSDPWFQEQDAVDPAVFDGAVRAMVEAGKSKHAGMFESDEEFQSTMMNIGRQGHSLDQVTTLMRGRNCTRVVLARPDVMFVNDVDARRLLRCDVPDDAWYVPNFGHWGGINDRRGRPRVTRLFARLKRRL